MLKINQLSFNYQKDSNILENISLQIFPNSFSLLYGPTGCGKSTLLKLIAGLYPKFGGQITTGKIQNSFKQWGMVFQNPDKQFTMQTPYQEFIFSLENLQLDEKQAKKRISLASRETNTQDLLERDFITLSGGEKQRVALAIIIAMDCDLVLLDEPFASCDPYNRKFLLEKLFKLKQEGKTIIITDHNLSGYQEMCDQVFLFKNKHRIDVLNNKAKEEFFHQPAPPQLSFQLPKDSKPILTFENFSLKQGDKTLIANQNLQIFPGHGTLLSGANGSGKTSLFKALTKLISYQGKITYQQQDISKIRRRKYLTQVAQVFQNASDQFLMVTVKEEIKLSQSLSNRFSTAEITNFLKLLQLDQLLDHVVYSLSGGQKKKLQLLLMMIANPNILLLDEPFTGLDKQSIHIISNLLRESFLDQEKTLIIISHQSDDLDLLCDYHLTLKDRHLQYITGGLLDES
ncbi:energy-coupling factor transport system ATP-binding protein [Lactobacillus colini]|uniref:Energy-coupling factor transport system ATP-binding protein n=1 Tax=Lactobacillus colini TaxID=1819254 RepID=A0ABS4MCT3_9LACO|nr:ABC transporter ATP-binding protein [Lactobacillus colini]MBP2057490.1 energy-coupling factor transport system ATP-binding protein [Lactobacillus colini]